jgi:hypothetical protein
MFNKIEKSGSLSNNLIKKSSMMKTNNSSAGGMTRLANSTGASVVRMAPKPFSPFYEESNLMLPRDRREINAWARHYYSTDPWVKNAIDLHSTYPLGAFGVKCDVPEVTKFFNDMLQRLNFSSMIYEIGKEFNIIGEVFPYSELNENSGEWDRIIIQNPDFIDVKSNILTDPVISLIPDEELKRLVTSSNPDDIAIREQIPDDVLGYIYAGKNIPLHPRLVSHLARKNAPYDVRGVTMLTCVFKDLVLRDKFREAQFVMADNHVTPLKIFKVGTADGTYRPTADDLVAFRNMLEQATYDPNFTIVTHPGLEVQYVGSNGAILPLDGEMDRIEDRVLTGLFTSKAFTHSEGPTYANASVALEVLQQRYVSFRTLIEKWLEWKIFRPVAKLQGFYRVRGKKQELIIPQVAWDKINLKNNREYQQGLEGLLRDNKVSLKSMYKSLDLNYEEEIRNIKEEIVDMKEIAYKMEQPYLGPENINVTEEGKEQAKQKQESDGKGGAAPEKSEGGGGDMGGMGGGDMGGGDMGDLGDLGDLGGGGADAGAGAAPEGAPPA